MIYPIYHNLARCRSFLCRLIQLFNNTMQQK
jgi:hypothetical protein